VRKEGSLVIPHVTVAPWVNSPVGHKLPGRSLIRTVWLDDLGEILSREAEPKRLSFEERAARAPSELTLLALPRTRFYGVSHGAAVCCLTARLNCFEFIFVLQGTLFTGAPPTQHRVTAGEAVLHLPGRGHCVRWVPDSKAIVLRIEPSVLSPFGFDPQGIAEQERDGRIRLLSLDSGLGRTLFGLCWQICEEAESSCAVAEQVRQEELLLYAVDLIVERLADPKAANRGRRPMPPYLKITLDYIYSNLEKELDARTLVGVSGTSIRTLQQAFARHFGKGPLTFVKHARLQRIRDELLRADPWEATVTDIATRWGVTHLSNFSRNYAELFGESPSLTLKQGRRSTLAFRMG
jgi:AraC-like DNA-binding protein